MNKNIFLVVVLVITLFSCSSEKEGDMIVQGTIKGLKKGTLYLQKVQDTLLVSVDSVFLNDESTFILTDNIIDPELYYLTLKEKSDEKIDFFGEKGTITINTKLEKFTTSATISGSKSNDLLKEYKEMASQFNGERLELIKENFEAQTAENDSLINEIDKDFQRLAKNRFRYTATFAIKNGNSEVAPYVAMTELYDAHITLLDTVNNSLSDKVKASKYGVKLDEFIKDIKENEVE